MSTQVADSRPNSLAAYVIKAVEQGFDDLSIRVKNGCGLVNMEREGRSFCIDKLDEMSPEADLLKQELTQVIQNPKYIHLGDGVYLLTAKGVDSTDGNVYHAVIKSCEVKEPNLL